MPVPQWPPSPTVDQSVVSPMSAYDELKSNKVRVTSVCVCDFPFKTNFRTCTFVYVYTRTLYQKCTPYLKGLTLDMVGTFILKVHYMSIVPISSCGVSCWENLMGMDR